MSIQSIGRVTGVHGHRVKVELDPDCRSSVRADLAGTDTVIAINSYLAFEIGAGEQALGVITDLEARETYDPEQGDLSLELVRPRRLATVQLLGTVRPETDGAYRFDPGITVLPTLDIEAKAAQKPILEAVLGSAPRHNRPSGHDVGGDYDIGLELGDSPHVSGQHVLGSFNDMFSRPIAIVGNTGSGKSCTIAQLLQSADKLHKTGRARFFVLDINGEYAQAFNHRDPVKRPNCAYIADKEFGIPIWLMNANEICEWLSATEQIQEPVLKNFWSLAKGGSGAKGDGRGFNDAREGFNEITKIINAIETGGPYVGQNANLYWQSFRSFSKDLIDNDELGAKFDKLDKYFAEKKGIHGSFGTQQRKLLLAMYTYRDWISEFIPEEESKAQESADKPLPVPLSVLFDPSALEEAARTEGSDTGVGQYLRGLRLRLVNRLKDRRWRTFINYEDVGIKSFENWLARLGLNGGKDKDICIIDCSMIANEVLPYICGVVGRVLLEIRQHVLADKRFNEPWVIVLEEAHNYVRPRRQIEDRGIAVSRDTFERIAKEGRKFGISLLIASQRPSEVSPTVLSQCANFIMHRLQNPDDIDYFRSIVPSQSRRLFEQIAILAPGEALIAGSAFHVPARVKVHLPNPEPASQSSAPYLAWQEVKDKPFPLEDALKNWVLLQKEDSIEGKHTTTGSKKEPSEDPQ